MAKHKTLTHITSCQTLILCDIRGLKNIPSDLPHNAIKNIFKIYHYMKRYLGAEYPHVK